jgi:hypothetical protein
MANPKDPRNMAAAGQKLYERARKYWGENHRKMLTREFDQTSRMENDSRWVCIIQINGVVIFRSEKHTSKREANGEASLKALEWMNENGME